jgi:hypothetical protein
MLLNLIDSIYLIEPIYQVNKPQVILLLLNKRELSSRNTLLFFYSTNINHYDQKIY